MQKPDERYGIIIHGQTNPIVANTDTVVWARVLKFPGMAYFIQPLCSLQRLNDLFDA
jgi:hypothetical protein